MSIASAAIHEAIADAWADYDIDNEFTQYWTAAQQAAFTSLNDGEAAPGQPYPYCVYEGLSGTISSRMSGHSAIEKHIIREIPWVFRVHAATMTGDSRSAKAIAASLIEVILKRFGGHPTLAPSQLTSSSGSIINMQYQSDYGLRTGDNEYQWTIEYLIVADVPVATG